MYIIFMAWLILNRLYDYEMLSENALNCKYKVVSISIAKNQNAAFLLMQNDLGADFKNLKSVIQSLLNLLAKIKCGICNIAVW